MKATINRPPATVTLEMSEDQATALRILTGGIGEEIMRSILGEGSYLTTTGRFAMKHFGSASPLYGDPMRQACEDLYNALGKAGVST